MKLTKATQEQILYYLGRESDCPYLSSYVHDHNLDSEKHFKESNISQKKKQMQI